jgi:hypothetical protein
MFKSYLTAVCLVCNCTMLAQTEIINRSNLPLRITNITYKHYDGISVKPTIEPNTYFIAPQETFSLDHKQKGLVSSFTVTFNSNKYTALLTAHTTSTLLATSEGTLLPSGAIVLEPDPTEFFAEDQLNMGIRKL